MGSHGPTEHCFVQEFTDWDALPERYAPLLAQAQVPVPWLTVHWFKLIFELGMDDNRRLRLFGLEVPTANGMLPVALLAARSPACPNGTIMHRRPIHPHSLSAVTGFQSHVFDLLVAPDFDRGRAWEAFGRHLCATGTLLHTIDLACLGPDYVTAHTVARSLRRRGFRPYVYRNFERRFQRELDDTFAAYASSRRAVKEYLRKERKLDREFDTQFAVFDDTADVEKARADYKEVAEASWKPPERFPEFMDALISQGLASGFVRIFAFYIDHQPVATVFAFVHDHNATLYRNDYNPDWYRRSVGSVCLCKALRHLIDEERIKSLDCGRDDEGYKQYWASSVETIYGVVAYNLMTSTGARGWVLHQIDRTKTAIKFLIGKG